MFERLKEMANEPVSDRWVDALVRCALALWTFGQIVFVHSAMGELPWVVDAGIAQLFQACVGGCLVAALACRGFGFRPASVVIMFCALVVAVSVWRKVGDLHLIVLLLFVLVARGMDLRSLFRCYVYSAIAGMLVVCGSSVLGMAATRVFLHVDGYAVSYGFSSDGAFGSILLSVLVGMVLGSREAPSWHGVVLLSVLSAIVALVVLGSAFVALLAIVFAVCVCVHAHLPDVVHSIAVRPEWHWLVAVAPVVLLCVIADGTKLFKLPATVGAYELGVGLYGYGALVCLLLMYVRSILLLGASGWSFLALCGCVLFSLLLVCEQTPLFMECNCTLLLLSRGMSSLGRPMPMPCEGSVMDGPIESKNAPEEA